MRARVSLVVSLLAAAALPSAAAEPGNAIVVRADIAKSEIERILNADNLDTDSMDAREVVDIIETIPRGRAPDDFWEAYQRHVDAWEYMAQLTGEPGEEADDKELEAADRAINRTFDEVERIARGYGARMPLPMTEVRHIA